MTKDTINADTKAITKERKTHGGKRLGAGRKTSASPYCEKTKVMRIPESKVTLVKKGGAANPNPGR